MNQNRTPQHTIGNPTDEISVIMSLTVNLIALLYYYIIIITLFNDCVNIKVIDIRFEKLYNFYKKGGEKMKNIKLYKITIFYKEHDEIKEKVIYSFNPPKVKDLKRHSGYMGYEYLRYTLALTDNDISNLMRIKENNNVQ